MFENDFNLQASLSLLAHDAFKAYPTYVTRGSIDYCWITAHGYLMTKTPREAVKAVKLQLNFQGTTGL